MQSKFNNQKTVIFAKFSIVWDNLICDLLTHDFVFEICRSGQILRIFFSTKPNPVGSEKKVVFLSISLGLKIAVLTEPSDQKTGRPGQKSKNYFLYKTHVG